MQHLNHSFARISTTGLIIATLMVAGVAHASSENSRDAFPAWSVEAEAAVQTPVSAPNGVEPTPVDEAPEPQMSGPVDGGDELDPAIGSTPEVEPSPNGSSFPPAASTSGGSVYSPQVGTHGAAYTGMPPAFGGIEAYSGGSPSGTEQDEHSNGAYTGGTPFGSAHERAGASSLYSGMSGNSGHGYGYEHAQHPGPGPGPTHGSRPSVPTTTPAASPTGSPSISASPTPSASPTSR